MKKAEMALISFTPGGNLLAERILAALESPLGGTSWEGVPVHKPADLKSWCRDAFRQKDALLFVGALGIVVRTIAPYLVHKTQDPAVLCMDELANYIIPVLSGHLGGGNELALELAKRLGAEAVITTASDVNGRLAIDVFAKKNGLTITSMEQAKTCAAAIVAGRRVGLVCEGRIGGQIPPELSASPEEADFCVTISPRTGQGIGSDALRLIPKAYILGLGCRKGKTAAEIEGRVLEELAALGLSIYGIKAVATIDLKGREPGLISFCEKYGIPLDCYSAEELMEAEGRFTGSGFVQTVTGVDNVCERAAVLRAKREGGGSKNGRMAAAKHGKEGITTALAAIEWSVTFE